jgi:hypothetical protein
MAGDMELWEARSKEVAWQVRQENQRVSNSEAIARRSIDAASDLAEHRALRTIAGAGELAAASLQGLHRLELKIEKLTQPDSALEFFGRAIQTKFAERAERIGDNFEVELYGDPDDRRRR